MNKEDILKLDSKKHVKIWFLNKLGMSRKEIAEALGTNPGHVGNEIKAYTANKEKRDAAESLLGGVSNEKETESDLYKKIRKEAIAAEKENPEIDEEGLCAGNCAIISGDLKDRLYKNHKIESEWIDVGNNKFDSIYESDHSALLIADKGLIVDTQVWQFTDHDLLNTPSIKTRKIVFTLEEYSDLGFHWSVVKMAEKGILTKGAIAKGPSHANGGIKTITPNGPLEIEGGEIVINKEASAKHCEELSKINQSAGGGVAFPCDHKGTDTDKAKHGAEIGEDKLKQGIEIKKEHTDLYNELSRLLEAEGTKMPMTLDEFCEWIAKAHIKEVPDYYELLKKYIEPTTYTTHELNTWWYGLDSDTQRYLFEDGERDAYWDERDSDVVWESLTDRRKAQIMEAMLNPENTAIDVKYGLDTLGTDRYKTTWAKNGMKVGRINKGDYTADPSKKPYFLLTKDETISERDRLEAQAPLSGKDEERMKDLCRYSVVAFNTLLSKLK